MTSRTRGSSTGIEPNVNGTAPPGPSATGVPNPRPGTSWARLGPKTIRRTAPLWSEYKSEAQASESDLPNGLTRASGSYFSLLHLRVALSSQRTKLILQDWVANTACRIKNGVCTTPIKPPAVDAPVRPTTGRQYLVREQAANDGWELATKRTEAE